jgi:agmatine deiminase
MSEAIDSTPRADGFRMPAEFEPHAQTWMLWPHRPDNWRLGAEPAQRAWVDVAAAIAQFELVTVGATHAQFDNARHRLPPQVRVVELSSDDAWMRDCGPSFVVNGRGDLRLVDWDFNGWGGLYDGLEFPWDADDAVPRKVAELERVDRYVAPLVLEGGAFHVDGEGTALTTEECLLSPGRNPDLSREQIERHLQDYLNVQKVVWLARGIDPDETNGHVDNVACFVRPGVVACAWTDDRDHPLYDVQAENLAILAAQTDARGRALEVHRIPLPAPLVRTGAEAGELDYVKGTVPRQAGDVLAASYVNFYVCNGGVVMPRFDDPMDEPAREAVQRLFPDRRVVCVPGREIVLGGGNVHCITQQQPRA